MSAPTPTKTNLPLRLAQACLVAPLLALGLGISLSILHIDNARVAAGLVRIVLLMGGFTLAFVAVFGGREPGRERLARHGLLGLMLNGTFLFYSAVMWPNTLATPAPSARERMRALSVSARELSLPNGMSNGVIHYSQLDLSKPGEALDAVTFAARGRSDADAAVLRAWSGVLTQLLAARLEVQRAGNALTNADVLNPVLITNGTRTALGDQFIARRLLANRYGSALHRWEHVLTSLGQNYADELKGQPLTADRVVREGERLADVMASRVRPLIDVCVAEQKVAGQYSRAISAMESCHPLNEISNPAAGASPPSAWPNKTLTEQLTKLEQAKKWADQLQKKLAAVY